MNVCKCLTSAVRWQASLILVAVIAAAGCSGDSYSPPSDEALRAIQNIGKWYQLYRADNGGKPPADEEAFLAFVNSQLTERGREAVDREKLLVSPRDGESYVVLYGKKTVRSQDLNIVAYEKTGAYGTKLVVTEMGQSRVLEDSDLQSLLSGN